MMSINVTAEQYKAIADCLKEYLEYNETKTFNSDFQELKWYRNLCQQGLRLLIREHLINLDEFSMKILRKHNILVPANILYEISLQVK